MSKKLILVALMSIVLIGNLFAAADTVVVPAYKDNGDPYVNSIIDYVVADTNDAGEQLNEVYKLKRGEMYLLNKAVNIHNPVEIVAENPVKNEPAKKPPKILSDVTEDGNAATMSFFKLYADFKLENVWLGGMAANGTARSWGITGAVRAIEDGISVEIDGLWMDYFSWSSIGGPANHTKWYINNLHARNNQNYEPWTTMLLYLEEADVVDSLVVENSTFFQNTLNIFKPQVVQYFELNHCTFANSMKWPYLGTQIRDAKITNNVFYNMNALGLTMTERDGQDPDMLASSIINIDTLAANESDTVEAGEYTIPEEERSFVVKNNNAYWSDGVRNYWANNDSVLTSPDNQWMNSRTETMFNSDASYPNLVAENNWVDVDPQFDQFDGLSTANSIMMNTINSFRKGEGFPLWDFDSDTAEYPDLYKVYYNYPTVEDFHHAKEMTGTDGKPIGDLNYYPEYDPVAIEDESKEINEDTDFELAQNYPNPFNPTTNISYTLEKPGKITLNIYNVLGEKVKTLVKGHSPAHNTVKWNGINTNGQKVSSGIYFYKLETSNNTKMRKMLLVK